MFHVNRQTDGWTAMTKLKAASRKFVNRLKNGTQSEDSINSRNFYLAE